MDPVFLTLEEVVEIHRDQITRYGGEPGIRDAGLLESALATPRAAFGGQFLHGDIFEMAAAYLFHIVKNHPFVDGNKRAGIVAALVFPATNDVAFKCGEDALDEIVLGVADGTIGRQDAAGFFRRYSR